MVYKQAERPYVIVGLHFDQVHLITDISGKYSQKGQKFTTPYCVSGLHGKHVEQVHKRSTDFYGWSRKKPLVTVFSFGGLGL